MDHIEGTFRGPRNEAIYYQAWLPEDGARAALILLHGLGSHSGRYMNVVDRLLEGRIAVYACDQIGHGRSGGARGRIRRFADFTGTLETFRGMAGMRQPGKPLFLFGHSMGGLIAVRFLLDHPDSFRGAVLSAPALLPAAGITPAAVLAGRILSVLAPGVGLFRLNPDLLTRDSEAVKAYHADRLVYHGKTPARLAVELLKAMRTVEREAAGITLPFLILLGSRDQVVNPDGAKMLYEKAASKDKTLKIYDGLYHETFNDPERGRVLGDMADWLVKRVK
ncbi:MAG: lysophospholipase [Anaerolineales bacterium]